MQKLLIRHAESEANKGVIAAFGHDGAPLTEYGRSQARRLTAELGDIGLEVTTEPVAVSPKIRARQTAEEAGFKNIIVTPVLDEVGSALATRELEKLLGKNKLPTNSADLAKVILSNPPQPRIWITHGIIIAAIMEELGLDRFIPALCSINEIDIDV